MTLTRRILLLFAALLTITATQAEPAADTMTGVMSPRIKSLQVRVCDSDGRVYERPAVIRRGTGQYILISFDELGEDRSYMRYEIIHCNALWVPEGLVDSEFIDGFNQADVDDYAYSQAVQCHYVNYRIIIPNSSMSPLLSGNYLLRVYPEGDPDDTLLQVRFSIDEGTVPIAADLTSRTDYDYNGEHQQLSIAVDTRRIPIQNIHSDLTVVVEQDGRTDNAVVVHTPLRVESSKAYFEHSRDLTFEAGNEYRRFEVTSDTYPGMGVETMSYAEPLYHAILQTDRPRCDDMYQYDFSQHGRYVIRRLDTADSNTGADYVMVHFSLCMPEEPDYDIYIEGDLTNRRFDRESLMVYNTENHCYEKTLLLKQGAYSYQYVAVPKKGGEQRGLTSVVEGDFYPTQHEYTIKVYYREPGTRYDRLAGFAILDPLHK